MTTGGRDVTARPARGPSRPAPVRFRRAPRKGERRRAALLEALGELLASQPLAKISINDIASAAGVTRQGFYFYFPTKAAAVAALLEGVYSEVLEATGRWHGVETGRANDELREGFDALLGYCREHPHLIVAICDAVGSDVEVREMWERWIGDLAERAIDKIIRERAAGRAPAGVDPAAVGLALVAMNERVLELQARAVVRGEELGDAVADALFEIWQRAIYGRQP